MKILSAEQIRDVDDFTIKNEPVRSIDLMERAANHCFQWLKNHYGKEKQFKIFCGPGNNGGDGLAIARLLAQNGYKPEVFIIRLSDKYSEDFQINEKRLKKIKKVRISGITDANLEEQLKNINHDDIIIDAVFGSGLNKPVKGFVAEVIKNINKSGAEVVAIDIPSGLFVEDNSDNIMGNIIRASHTLSLELAKLAFMFAENDEFTGAMHIISIGLHKERIEKQKSPYILIGKPLVSSIIKPRKRFAHKGDFGHAFLCAGSYGMMGAAVLAAKSCLKSGAGLVTVNVPKAGYHILQTSVPEALVRCDNENNHLSECLKLSELEKFTAIGFGPGTAKNSDTAKILKHLIQNIAAPLLIDADGLNILSENKTWLSFLPRNSILTPHPGEFDRMAGESKSGFIRHQNQIKFAVKHHVYVVLKGAYTAIACPDGTCYFNATGNPGMATGGSGDVLTGIILGLLAQKYSPLHACIAGVYLHGFAGDIAADAKSEEALIASDIINALGYGFLSF